MTHPGDSRSWVEPWLFGFPGPSAVEFLRRAGLDAVTDLSYAELGARYAQRPDGTSPLPVLAADKKIRRIAVAEVRLPRETVALLDRAAASRTDYVRT